MKASSTLLLLAMLIASITHAEDRQPLAIGSQVGAFTLGDYRGKEWSLADFDESKVVVVAFLGTECPLVKLYSGRLGELSKKYGEQGVAFVGINSNQQDSLTEIAHLARTHKIDFPLLKDPGNGVADQFGAERTPEIFVLDQARKVRYHGRIDDQYTYGLQRPKVEHDYLVEALDALLAGEQVATKTTEVVGCHIGRLLLPQADSKVTYSNQISRIFQKRCVECHRDGEIAPFALTDYDEVVGWAEMIAEVVDEQRMPPWHASDKHGDFINDARLTDDEKELIFDWVDAGAPQGNPSDLPKPRQFVEGWRIGKPDLVIHMRDEPFQVPAEGEVRYQYFSVDPGFKEDKWIKAAECRPGNRAVVHHIIVAVASRDRIARSEHGGLRSEWLTATAPGARPLILPDGMAKLVPAGSKLVFQMHYTPNGTPQEDRSSVGFIFADPKTVKKQVATHQASNGRFRIPPNADAHPVDSRYRFKEDSLVLSLFPHMHLRGKSFRYTAVYPDGREEVLLDVPRYDFNWQNGYELREPKRMPAGTILKCKATFDNSTANLANPDPTKTVRWGDQTWEEMMIGYFDMALVEQDLTALRRTDQFLAHIKEQPIKLDEPWLQRASGALESNKTLLEFGKHLRDIVPQVDRIDWMTVVDDELKIERVAQSVARSRSGAGLTFPAAGLSLARYAEGDETIVHADTDEVKTADFQLLKRLFGSSMHVPVRFEDKVGIVSFWSTESNAFPPEAVEVLEGVVAKLASAGPGD